MRGTWEFCLDSSFSIFVFFSSLHIVNASLTSSAELYLKIRFSLDNHQKSFTYNVFLSCCKADSFVCFILFVPQSAKSLQNSKDSRILWVKDDRLVSTGFDTVRTSQKTFYNKVNCLVFRGGFIHTFSFRAGQYG